MGLKAYQLKKLKPEQLQKFLSRSVTKELDVFELSVFGWPKEPALILVAKRRALDRAMKAIRLLDE